MGNCVPLAGESSTGHPGFPVVSSQPSDAGSLVTSSTAPTDPNSPAKFSSAQVESQNPDFIDEDCDKDVEMSKEEDCIDFMPRAQIRREIVEALASHPCTRSMPVEMLRLISDFAEDSLLFLACDDLSLNKSNQKEMVPVKPDITWSMCTESQVVCKRTREDTPSAHDFSNTYDDWVTVPFNACFEAGRKYFWEIAILEHRTTEVNGVVAGIFPCRPDGICEPPQCIGWSGEGWGAGNWGQQVVRNTQSGSFRRVRQGDSFGFCLELNETGDKARFAFFVNGSFQTVIMREPILNPLRAGVCLFYPETKVQVRSGRYLPKEILSYQFEGGW